MAVRFPSRLGTHTLAWNGDWRNIHGFNHDIPMSLRSHAGHSLKSSLRHSLEIDERDSPFLPSSGFHVKVTQELAGIGGDVFFGKSEVQGTYYQPLPAGWVSSNDGERKNFTFFLWISILMKKKAFPIIAPYILHLCMKKMNKTPYHSPIHLTSV